jgi:hypothetical protein
MEITIIPAPVSAACTGGVFQCAGMPLLESSGEFEKEAALFREQTAGIFSRTYPAAKLVLKKNHPEKETPPEAYKLVITSNTKLFLIIF